ncbi:glycosyltransferase 87 family protein [Sphaerisporangium sp. NPDC005288]|uniref:glycosyltransferase 87 family protein n=1 Tax=Sphaerisporangium sp. NPDC005288 TaxID=3155114 RepID=UPI0033A72A3A
MRTGGGRGRWWAWPIALLIIVVAAVPLVRYWLTNPADQRLVDLDVYRTGGESLLRGLPVYDAVTPAPQLLPFTYPPIAALLAVPLAVMSWPAAQWVWTAGVLACLGVTAWFGFREPLTRLRPAWAGPVVFGVMTAACLYLMPLRDQIRFGQVDILLVMLCLADCVARRPWWPRGMLIGLATAIKLTPGVFLVYLLVTGFGRDAVPEQRRAFFMAVFTATLLTVLPFLVIPHDAASFWFSALLDGDRVGANNATTNQSIRGMLLRLYLPGWLTSLIWLALGAVVAWYGFRRAREALLRGDRMTAVALTGLMAVLVSPVAWIHHLAWLVVVLAALAGRALGDRTPLAGTPLAEGPPARGSLAGGALIGGTLAGGALTGGPADGRDAGARASVSSGLTGAAVVAGVWLYYVLPIPWWGVSLRAADIPVLSPVAGRVVQDAFGLGAVALVWLLGRRPAAGVSGPAEPSPDETSPDETSPDETSPDETSPDETSPGDGRRLGSRAIP